MLDFNMINGLVVLTAIMVFLLVIKPYFNSKEFAFYDEIKLGLLMFGFTFRDEKIKAMADVALNVVKQLEILDLAADEKHYLAVDEVFRALLEEFNVDLPEDAISLMVQAAVAMLPKTHK